MFLTSIQSTIRQWNTTQGPQPKYLNIPIKFAFGDIIKGSGSTLASSFKMPGGLSNHFKIVPKGFLSTPFAPPLYVKMQNITPFPKIGIPPVRWEHTTAGSQEEPKNTRNSVLSDIFKNTISFSAGTLMGFYALLFLILLEISRNSDPEEWVDRMKKMIDIIEGKNETDELTKNLKTIHLLLQHIEKKDVLGNEHQEFNILINSLKDTINKVQKNIEDNNTIILNETTAKHQNEIRRLEIKHKDEIEKLTSDYSHRLSLTQAELHKHQYELSYLNDLLGNERNQDDAKVKKLKEDLYELSKEYEDLKTHANTLQTKLNNIESGSKKEMEVLEEDYKKKITNIEAWYNGKFINIELEYKQQLEELNARYISKTSEESKKLELYAKCPKEDQRCLFDLHKFFLEEEIATFSYKLSPKFMQLLNEALKENINKSVKILIFKGTYVKNDNGLKHLMLGLKNNTTIQSVDLENTGLENKDLKSIADMLEANKAIKELNLSNNPNINNVGADILKEALKSNKTLKRLDLSGSNVHEIIKNELRNTLGISVL